MKLEDLKTVQMREIMQYAESLEEVLTPAGVVPKTRHDYPKCLAICDKLKRVCQIKRDELNQEIQLIEDRVIGDIEEERIVLEFKHGAPVYRKKYPNLSQRERECRVRLSDHADWKRLVKERDEWDLMSKDWLTHHDKLRRESKLIEEDYLHNGGQEIKISKSIENL